MKLFLRKMPGGTLVPDNDETAEWLQKVKNGDVLGGEFARPRNYKFLQKMHCLAHLAFDRFTEYADVGLAYRGMKAVPAYDRFRKDLTILAGHYTATYDIMGNVKLEAKSWSFANCTEEEAEKIYSDLINAALKQVFKFSISEEQLRKTVDDILAFA